MCSVSSVTSSNFDAKGSFVGARPRSHELGDSDVGDDEDLGTCEDVPSAHKKSRFQMFVPKVLQMKFASKRT